MIPAHHVISLVRNGDDEPSLAPSASGMEQWNKTTWRRTISRPLAAVVMLLGVIACQANILFVPKNSQQQQQDWYRLSPGSFYKADTTEKALNRVRTGPCYGTHSQVFGFSETFCEPDGCVWSHKVQQNIDISLYPFRFIRRSKRLRCPPTRGGQYWTGNDESDITISFIIATKNDVINTMACITQIFKVSREVDAAEVIVVDDGSTVDIASLQELIQSLKDLFGFKISMLRNSESLGTIICILYLGIVQKIFIVHIHSVASRDRINKRRKCHAYLTIIEFTLKFPRRLWTSQQHGCKESIRNLPGLHKC